MQIYFLEVIAFRQNILLIKFLESIITSQIKNIDDSKVKPTIRKMRMS